MSMGGHDADALVVLEGGPPGLPREAGTAPRGDGERIKVPYRGGYEHFERVGVDGSGATPVVVYRWVQRTAVAE
ncbi:Uncharacterised protein [Mycobacterium tuberculosis]|nr:Uncharacterised protein [Mycobacterium tuberculosis]